MEQSELEKRITNRSLLYSACLLTLLFITAWAVYIFAKRSMMEHFDQDQYGLLNVLIKETEDSLKEVQDDLFYLSESPFSQDVLEHYNPDSEKMVSGLIFSMLNYQEFYDHIRLLDATGKEVIRINYDEDLNHHLVEQNLLQDKSDKYYFTRTMEIDDRQYYMSHFDLNVEMGEIETPHKPVIRFARKVLDEDGNVSGIGIFNYKGQFLTDKLRKYVDERSNHFYLINEEGYYLYNKDSSKTFSFLFDGSQSFATEYPQIWKAMEKSGEVVSKRGYFYYDTLNGSHSDNKWYFVLHTDPEQIARNERTYKQLIAISLIIISPLLVLFASLLARSHEKNHWYLAELERLAQRDGLTGLYNMREAMNRLEYTISLVKRTSQDLSIAFIDVNNLKFFNDSYGHHMGDTLIREASQSIRDNIRSSDTAARIGGDEFLIIFPECPLNEAEAIVEKIYHTFFERGREIHGRGEEWTFCWGCAAFDNQGETLNEFISRADKIMYESKKHKYKLGNR
ncbi:MAG: sensor domain-containing diguanylate cyclase [Spirochaetales bacterium]|nr:sensor domain-containing diguanylate cyclase [Spirochaetales bacterium]